MKIDMTVKTSTAQVSTEVRTPSATAGMEVSSMKFIKGEKGDPGKDGKDGASNWAEVQGKPFSSIDSTTLVATNGVLKVNVVDVAETDNTLPISSSGVKTIVGNIDALLASI